MHQSVKLTGVISSSLIDVDQSYIAFGVYLYLDYDTSDTYIMICLWNGNAATNISSGRSRIVLGGT